MQIPLRVLLVEDELSFAKAIAKRFRNVSKFEIATSLAEANRLMGMASTPFDAFVLDVHLPDGNSLEWLEKLRSFGFDGRVIVMSSDPDALLPVRSAQAPRQAAFLRKGGDVERLSAALVAFLERVATDAEVTRLLSDFVADHGLSKAEGDVVEAARWVRSSLIRHYVGRPKGTVKKQVKDVNRKTGMHSIEAVVTALHNRACSALYQCEMRAFVTSREEREVDP